MAITQVSTSVLKDGAVTSAKLDTNIAIDGNLTVDTNTLFVDSSNNRVGIGTTSPATNLHILSASSTPTVRIESTHPSGIPFLDLKGAASSQIRYIDETGTIQTRIDMSDNGGFSFVDVAGSASPRMVINSSGNVGIGTTNPSNGKLVIQESGTSTGSTLSLIGTNTGGSASQVSQISSYQPSGGAGQDAALDFKVRSNPDPFASPSTIMTLLGSGNVGIKGTGTKLGWERASDNSPNIVYLTKNEDLGVNGNAKLHGYDGIIFSTEGIETPKMTIDINGNVGIGTTLPSYKLHIKETAANAKMYINGENGANTSSLLIGRDARNWEIKTDTAVNGYKYSLSYIGTDAPVSNIFTALSNGNVGIGETNPSEKLEVKDGSIRTTTLNSFSNLISGRASVPTAAGYNIGGLLFQAYRTGTTYATGAAIFSYSDGGAWTSTSVPSYLSFHTAAVGAANTTERMIIDSNGDLTLGATTSPKLYMRSTGGNGNNQRFYIDGFADGGGAGYGGGFRIHTRDSVNVWHERMRITSSGNVGIGTTNPTDKLSVYTSTDYGNNSEYANATIGLGNTAYPVSIRSYRYGGSYLNGLDLYYNNGTPQLGMRITSVGNVGIGTASPDAQLTIEGNSPIINIRNKQESESGIRFVDTATDAQSARIMYDSGASNALIFYNNATNERMRILSSGGITFNGDTATANALDDYEEGTWTPSFSDEGNVTSLVKQGDAVYTKIGRVVHLTVEVAGAFTSSTAESSFSFTIPFLAYSTTFDNVGTATFFIGSGADRFGIGSVFLGTTSNGKTFVYIPAREVQQSGSWGQMRISLTYFAS